VSSRIAEFGYCHSGKNSHGSFSVSWLKGVVGKGAAKLTAFLGVHGASFDPTLADAILLF